MGLRKKPSTVGAHLNKGLDAELFVLTFFNFYIFTF